MSTPTAPSSRVVLITGATGGVGRGIALACGRAGWDVWIAARREAQGATVAAEVDAAGGRGHFVQCDVTDQRSVETAVAHVARSSGVLHGVVHNSTSGHSSSTKPITDVTMDELEDHIAVSLRGTYLLARTAHPWLQASGSGSYVIMTSEAGFEGKRLLAAYALVKAAQRGVMRSLAREWGPDAIRVNAVGPLALSPAMEAAFANEAAMEARVLGRIPLRRLGDATDDIGRTVRFLLSDEAAYVTAQTVMVDGGSCPIS